MVLTDSMMTILGDLQDGQKQCGNKVTYYKARIVNR